MKRHFRTIRIFFIVFIIMEAISLVCIKYHFDTRTSELYNLLHNNALHQFHLKENYVSKTFIPLVTDIEFLSNQRSLKQFILDRKDSLYAIEDLKNFTRSNFNYEQVRFIDINGDELIRINQNDSVITLVNKHNLQNKRHRDYFKNTLALNEGEVYISRLDLNIENGQIELPFNPMIRVGTPILINGKKQGVLVLNFKANNFIKNLKNINSINQSEFFLLNEQGSILAGPASYEKFSFVRDDSNKDFESYFPNVWRQVNQKSQESIVLPNGFLSFKRIYPYNFNSQIEKKLSKRINKDETSWVMVSFIDDTMLDNRAQGIERESIKYIIMSIIVSIMTAIIITNYRSKELITLKKLNDLKETLEYGFMTRTKELVQAKRQLELKIDDLRSSIRYAKKVQETKLPEGKLVKKYFLESFIYYMPKAIVAGDFYWMHSFNKTDNSAVENNFVLFAVADCTGHGVPGAMVSLVCFNALNKAVKEEGIVVPSKILDRVADLVEQAFQKGDSYLNDGMDISICCLDTNYNTLQWAGANNPVWILRDSKILEFKPNRRPIGCCDTKIKKPFTLHEIKLEKGDIIYQFTDGYADQFNGVTNKKLMKGGLKKVILEIGKLDSMEDQKEALISFINIWKGDSSQVDDICVVGLKI